MTILRPYSLFFLIYKQKERNWIQYMNTIVWEVKHLSLPRVIRYCKKCGTKTEYISAGSFRVNAQKKYLDIWLIYRCARCGTTWNLTIYSRVNAKTLDWDTLGKFTSNHAKLAERYAMDAGTMEKNGVEVETPPYRIVGDDIDLSQSARVKIVSKYPLKLRLSKILREKLSLSKKTFDEMVSAGMIRTENGADIRKCRLQSDTIVMIDCSAIYRQDFSGRADG